MSSTYLVSGHLSTRTYYQCDGIEHETHEGDLGYEFIPPEWHRVEADSEESAAAVFIRERLTDSSGRCSVIVFDCEAISPLTRTSPADRDIIGDEWYCLFFEASLAPDDHADNVMPCCGTSPTNVLGSLSLDVRRA